MCHYCNLEDYFGERLPLEVEVNGTKEYYEAYLLDDVENEQFSLIIDGTFRKFKIEIEYCPKCGEKIER